MNVAFSLRKSIAAGNPAPRDPADDGRVGSRIERSGTPSDQWPERMTSHSSRTAPFFIEFERAGARPTGTGPIRGAALAGFSVIVAESSGETYAPAQSGAVLCAGYLHIGRVSSAAHFYARSPFSTLLIVRGFLAFLLNE